MYVDCATLNVITFYIEADTRIEKIDRQRRYFDNEIRLYQTRQFVTKYLMCRSIWPIYICIRIDKTLTNLRISSEIIVCCIKGY